MKSICENNLCKRQLNRTTGLIAISMFIFLNFHFVLFRSIRAHVRRPQTFECGVYDMRTAGAVTCTCAEREKGTIRSIRINVFTKGRQYLFPLFARKVIKKYFFFLLHLSSSLNVEECRI